MSNEPVLIAYSVKKPRKSGKPVWTRIGAAWPHETGAGLTVIIEPLPLKFDGRIVLLEPKHDAPPPYWGEPRPK
jgi:hypothetical protein